MRMEFSAGGIIYKKEGQRYQFALILDAYDKWTFPKGRIEKKESPTQAALREIEEEIGLKNLEFKADLGKIDYWFKNDQESIHKFVYFYLMKAPAKGQLKPETSEIKDARWFTPKKAKEILAYKKDSLAILKKALAVLKIPEK